MRREGKMDVYIKKTLSSAEMVLSEHKKMKLDRKGLLGPVEEIMCFSDID